MNYRSQLRAHAFEQSARIHKTEQGVPDFNDIKGMADQIAEYCYIPLEDLHDTAKYLIDLCQEADSAKIAEIIQALEVAREQREHMEKAKQVVEETKQ